MAADPAERLAPVVAASERALSDAWGGRVELLPLNPAEAERPNSTVARCLVHADHAEAPATVIVKSPRNYNASEVAPHTPAGRLFNEWAALRFLSSLNTTLAPRLYAADRSQG